MSKIAKSTKEELAKMKTSLSNTAKKTPAKKPTEVEGVKRDIKENKTKQLEAKPKKSLNTVKGKKGEISAKQFLEENKYKIVAKNYKNPIGEIDLIAIHQGVCVFIEVKNRGNLRFGYPREAVNYAKQQKIRNTATGFLKANRMLDHKVRFDVIEILDGQLTHIIDAF